MQCWFKKDNEWLPGFICGYVPAAGGGVSAIVKPDKRGSLSAIPIGQVSAHTSKPAEDHPHYIDPRDTAAIEALKVKDVTTKEVPPTPAPAKAVPKSG